jgi:hypothetical protein
MKNKQVITPPPSLPPAPSEGGGDNPEELSLGRNYKNHTNPAFRRNVTNKDKVTNLWLAKSRERYNITRML